MGSENVANVTAAVRMQNDATGTIIGTCAIDFKLPLYELNFAFERGRITIRDLDGDLELIDYASGRHTVHALTVTFFAGINIARVVWQGDQCLFGFSARRDATASAWCRRATRTPVRGRATERSIAQGKSVRLDTTFESNRIAGYTKPTSSKDYAKKVK